MDRVRLLHRLGYLAPLLAAAAYFEIAPDAGLPRWAFFAVLAAYARLGAVALGAGGSERVLLFVDTLPFLAYAHAVLGRELGPMAVLSVVEGAAAGAALLSVEALALPGPGTFPASLPFVAAACGAGLALESTAPAASIPAAVLVLAGSRYLALRRRRP